MSQDNAATLIDIQVEQQQQLATKEKVLRELGQIQAFDFMQKLASVASLRLLQNIKNTKVYKGLSYTDVDGKVATVATWEDFCKNFVGASRRTVDDRILNLEQLGEEFFEQAQQMKLGPKDLRDLRQLPKDDQALVLDSEAVESGDAEAVKEFIDELKDKHAKETEKLNTELDATERMLNASRKSGAEKEDQIIKLKAESEAKKFSADKWKGETKNFFEVLVKTENQIREGFNKMLLLSEQLETIQMDDKTYHAAKSAFYADNKILLTQLAGMWNEIHRTYGDLDDTKPSGEWLEELGFEGTEVME
ncbi:hypothetical protein [Pseudoalteromonas luteoviolacea]|uniref:hypothetical protein n=1 Tax=Pseudoalteromonas luteoviolacea TaxID=43657 RepID=UPI001153EA1B|nr:hypothetical protein [Pseudoalteromonas luteoviolacea]TQF69578.1 hypothetical protein FLM44_00225 [Pseudoalteromonas luteoviolacea]